MIESLQPSQKVIFRKTGAVTITRSKWLILFTMNLESYNFLVDPVDSSSRIQRLHLCRGVRPSLYNEYLVYDTKQSDDEAPLMPEFWGMRSTP